MFGVVLGPAALLQELLTKRLQRRSKWSDDGPTSEDVRSFVLNVATFSTRISSGSLTVFHGHQSLLTSGVVCRVDDVYHGNLGDEIID